MVKVRFAIKESRKRDRKRKRLVLSVGKRKYHITQAEGYTLYRDLSLRLN